MFDLSVAMNDFALFRKDRGSRGGGLAVYVKSKIPCKVLTTSISSITESLWLHLRPTRLPRSISSILLAVIYHPPNATSDDNNKLYNHIQET